MMWVADQRKEEVGRRWSWSEFWDFSYVVETFEPNVFFFFLVELACHVYIYNYFNKTVSHISIFYPSLNNNDQNNTRMKG